MLRHLVDAPGRLVTKDELLSAVWRDTIVSDAALDELHSRSAQGAGRFVATPRYIETVHRRGFRFIGPVARPAGSGRDGPRLLRADAAAASAATLVGRDAELARLHELFATAAAGSGSWSS